jgi:hypothetical protein
MHLRKDPKDPVLEEENDLFQLNDLTINSLEYDTTENNVTTTQPLPKGDMGMIRSFILYVHHRRNSVYDPIGNDWTTITRDALDEFRTDLMQIYKFNSVDTTYTTSISTTPSPLSAGSSLSSQSPFDLFKRGIKRDFSAFPTLKDENNNEQCHSTFTNMALAQDTSDVLNPKYVPLTTAAYNLFWEKQKFLYAVLDAKV